MCSPHCSQNTWVLCSWCMDLFKIYSLRAVAELTLHWICTQTIFQGHLLWCKLHMSRMGLPPKVQYHPARELALSASKLSRQERKVLDTALQFHGYEPPLPAPTDLFCCVTVNGRRIWLCYSFLAWTLDQERIQCQLQSPAVCQHSEREPGARQHPKGLSVEHHDSRCALDCLSQSHHNSLVNSLWTLVCTNRSSTQNIPFSALRKAFQNITKYVKVLVITFAFLPVHILKCIQQAKTYKKRRTERSEGNTWEKTGL